MNNKPFYPLLVSAFVAMVFLVSVLIAEEQAKKTGSSPEADGTEGFSVPLIPSVTPSTTTTDSGTSSSDGVASEASSADGAVAGAPASDTTSTDEAILDGVVEVDTYLNIRSGPWGKIIGSLNNSDKIKILSKEGDWFKIVHGGGVAFIHSYYVSAPGYPSHQGVEPPILGSDQEPGATIADVGATVDNGTFGADPCTPMPDSVSSDYGPRDIGIGSTYHEGIDLPISNGTPLNALGNGVVTEAGWADGGGNFVRIQYDNGYSSLYYHLENVTVGEGQRVAIGQNVGYSDNTGAWTTGPHLHMGIFDSSGSSVNPRDVPGLEFPPLVE